MKKEITVLLNDYSQIFNEYNDSLLKEELGQYIFNQCKGVPLKSNISVNIVHKMPLNPKQKDKIVDEIREYFGVDIKENLIRLKYERVKQIIFIIIGLLLLIASNFFNAIHITLAGQVLSIFGWVIIWEFVYSLIFFNFTTRLENKRNLKIIKSKITFTEFK